MSRIINPNILTKEDLAEAQLNMDYPLRMKLQKMGLKTRDAQVDYILGNSSVTGEHPLSVSRGKTHKT